MNDFDVLIRDVRLIDGTAAPWFKTDVGFRGAQIAAIGDLAQTTAIEVVEGGANYLCPGFIDSHTHDDVAILHDRDHAAKVQQGVTTLVVGNCGFANYPADEQKLARLHLSSLLGEVKEQDLFQDFSHYQEAINATGLKLNIVSLAGHGPLRLSVMGYERRAANSRELDRICHLLDEQLQQGAYGLSLGLAYPPSAFAGREELVRLAAGLKSRDRLLAAHIRSYDGALLDAIDEFIDLIRVTGVKALLSHLQIAGRPYWGRMPQALEKIEAARAEGLDLSVDMYPYPAGSSTILQLLPPSAQEGGLAALLDRLDDPSERERIRRLTESGREPGWESKIALIGWENVRIASVSHPNLKEFEGTSITEAAKNTGMSPSDFTFHAIQLDQGTTNIIMFQQSEEDLRAVHRFRLQMVGSDSIPRAGGKPHPRMYGSFPRVIGRLAMRERLIPVEEAVRRVSSLPAQRFQIPGRGILRPGSTADCVLFNNDFLDRATFEDPQLSPTGLVGVWISGIRVLRNGELLEPYPGRMLSASTPNR